MGVYRLKWAGHGVCRISGRTFDAWGDRKKLLIMYRKGQKLIERYRFAGKI
jgi:hypothetical protein